MTGQHVGSDGIMGDSPNIMGGGAGDFWALLSAQGYRIGRASTPNEEVDMTQATTILAVKYADGVLVAGDRRATAGTMVMYDRADKVLEVDRHSVLAIAGVPATAFEIARVLEHSLKYYRRSQLQEMSLEGKARAISRLLKDNIPMAVQGIGAVAPIFAAFDTTKGEGKIYFYDILGAEFEGVLYATSGSGAPGIRGAMHFADRWGEKPLARYDEQEAIVLALRLLETAAEFDSATGGVNRDSEVYPIIKTITADGVVDVSLERLRDLDRDRVIAKRRGE